MNETTDKGQTDMAGRLMERLASMRAVRSPWEGLWQEIADYVMPRRTMGLSGSLAPSTEREGRLFDTTAVQANITLANGCLAWMSPQESPWFAFDSPVEDAGDEALSWLSKSGSKARQSLAVSNFYTSIHEFYLDRSAFGTACLYVEPGRKNGLNVQCWPVGTFCIDEDDEGNVDTVFREFDLTARQFTPPPVTKQHTYHHLPAVAQRMNGMREALARHEDVLYFDADIVFLDRILVSSHGFDVALSHSQSVQVECPRMQGVFNAGMVWTRLAEFPNWWQHRWFNPPDPKVPELYEQASLNDVPRTFATGYFDLAQNHGFWHGSMAGKKLASIHCHLLADVVPDAMDCKIRMKAHRDEAWEYLGLHHHELHEFAESLKS